ncbi:MAG: DUF1828 domain-containing protein [Desulfamplus sp.]|nr:DUF1828 domain-containing protein [Desulfamplus sp.]
MKAKELLNEYYAWLRDNTAVEENLHSGWTAINTPFTGLFNDTIELYIKINGSKINISDDGITLNNLEEIGITLFSSPNRKRIFDNILLNFGIKLTEGELHTECSIKDFPQRKHLFLQALIEINDMAMLSKHSVASVFKDDVEEYLDELGVIYTKDFKFTGISGIDFNFDFLIAEHKKEKILRAINYLNKTTLTTFLFAWGDIIESRKKVSKKEISALAIINNKAKDVKTEYLEALKIKSADYILWTEKDTEENIQKLKAAA